MTTDDSGVATAPTLTANGTVGSYLATGTVTGIATPANYSLTNTLSAGAAISTGGNGSGTQSTPIHTAFPLPLQAVVKDSGGVGVPGVTITFTVPDTGPSGTFPGGVLSVQVTTDATGTATSPTLTANGTVGGPYTAPLWPVTKQNSPFAMWKETSLRAAPVFGYSFVTLTNLITAAI